MFLLFRYFVGGPRPPRPVLPEELRRQKQNEVSLQCFPWNWSLCWFLTFVFFVCVWFSFIPKVDECLKQVKEAMDNENYLKALANLHKAFDLCSKHGLAPTYDMHIIRSKINFEAGEYEYAAEYVQDAISLDENNPSGYILKASIQRERKQWELGPLLSALQRFPRNVRLIFLKEISFHSGFPNIEIYQALYKTNTIFKIPDRNSLAIVWNWIWKRWIWNVKNPLQRSKKHWYKHSTSRMDQ